MRVLVTGADGQLGRDLLDSLAGRVPAGGRRCSLLAPEGPLRGLDYDVLATDIGTMRVDEREAVLTVFHEFKPDLVLHGGALTAVDLCETEVDTAYAVNAVGTRNVAEAATAVQAHLLYVSTDYVFDGTSDAALPGVGRAQSRVGLRRQQAGRRTGVPARDRPSCARRGSAGPTGRTWSRPPCGWPRGDGTLRFVDDQHGSPTFTADLAPAIVTLGTDRRPGIFHVTNQGATTWWGFVRAVLEAAGRRSRAGAAHHHGRPRPAPSRHRVRPTRCSTTWPCA